MTTALAYKEFRETIGIAAIGLALLLGAASVHMGWNVLPYALSMNLRGYWHIPFLNDAFVGQFAMVAFGLAAALGLRQSLGDFIGDGYLFLLHRPVSRGQIYAAKLAVGLAMYFAFAALPVLLYAWWASLPGTHASPFDWAMTIPAWTTLLAMTAVYFGAFLAGIRPANWFGSKLAPLVAAGALLIPVMSLPTAAGLPILLVGDALLVWLILYVAQNRDFPG